MKRRLAPAEKVLALSIALFFSFSALFLVLLRYAGSDRIWKGYRLVLIDESVSPAKISEALSSAGFSGILSPDRASVNISMFGEQEYIPVDRLTVRFDAEDPRYNAYLRKLPDLFKATDSDRTYTIFYVPSDDNAFTFAGSILSALDGATGPGTVWIPENGMMRRIVRIGLFALCAGLIILRSGKIRLYLIPGAATLCLFLFFEGRFTLVGTGILFFFWAEWVITSTDYLRRKIHYPDDSEPMREITRRAIPFIAVFIVYVVLELIPMEGVGQPITAVCGFLSAGAAGAGLLSLTVIRGSNSIHRLFIPISIKTGAVHEPAQRLPVLETVLMCLILVSGPFLTEMLAAAGTPVVPRFQPTGLSAGFSWETLETLRRNGQTTEQGPDMSDFIAHNAFFSTFQYGGKFRLPEEGKTETIMEYKRGVNGVVKAVEKAVFTYDEQWLQSIIGAVGEDAPEMLLIKQGRPGIVMNGRISTLRISFAYIVIHLLFCFLSGLISIVAIKNLTSPSLYGMRNTIIRRERQTV